MPVTSTFPYKDGLINAEIDYQAGKVTIKYANGTEKEIPVLDYGPDRFVIRAVDMHPYLNKEDIRPVLERISQNMMFDFEAKNLVQKVQQRAFADIDDEEPIWTQ